MKAVVLVPYRSDGDVRERNWACARKAWEASGLPIYEGDSDGRIYDSARARNAAAALAGEWDVALFADADVILGSPGQAHDAITMAGTSGAYTVAHSRIVYLSEHGSDYVLSGGPADFAEIDIATALTWETVFAVPHSLWEEVGGFDERFRGWGGQVAAFYYAASTLGGSRRISGDVYHLHHSYVDEREPEPYLAENLALAERYHNAAEDPEAMLALIAERG